jgi:hypothetical protein
MNALIRRSCLSGSFPSLNVHLSAFNLGREKLTRNSRWALTRTNWRFHTIVMKWQKDLLAFAATEDVPRLWKY